MFRALNKNRTLVLTAIAIIGLTGCPHHHDDNDSSPDATANQAILWTDHPSALAAGDQPDVGTLTTGEYDRTYSAACADSVQPILFVGETELPSGFRTAGVSGKWKMDSLTTFTSVTKQLSQSWPFPGKQSITGGFLSNLPFVGCQTAERSENVNSVMSIPYELDAGAGNVLVTATLVLQSRKGKAGGQLQLAKDLKPLPTIPAQAPEGVRAVFAKVSDTEIVMRVEMSKPNDTGDGTSVMAAEVTYFKE